MLLAVAACAKQPEQIGAVDIGPNPYLRFGCDSLAKEHLALDQNLANLSAAQKSAAGADTLGVLLLGLPISSMSGNDNEAKISIVKGRIQAVESVQAARKC